MRRAAGFTLLEVIISLTITSLIAVMAYGALRLGARATQRGEEKKDEDQRTRALLSLVRRQLKSAYAYPLTDQGDSFVYFFGDRESFGNLVHVADHHQVVVAETAESAQDRIPLMGFALPRVLLRGVRKVVHDELGEIGKYERNDVARFARKGQRPFHRHELIHDLAQLAHS